MWVFQFSYGDAIYLLVNSSKDGYSYKVEAIDTVYRGTPDSMRTRLIG